MVQAFWRWMVLRWMRLVSPKSVLFLFYTNGAVGGFIGWVEVKGYGTLAFVTPDGYYVYRW